MAGRLGSGSAVADVGAITEKMLEPGPMFADGGLHLLSLDAFQDISRGQAKHEQAAIRIPAVCRLPASYLPPRIKPQKL